MNCLFCRNDGPYSTIEHIIPESMGNTQLVLFGAVCDACQAYLGKEIEEYVLRRSPLGAWRVLAGVTTKRGRTPRFSFQQPRRDKGILPDRHPETDDSVMLRRSQSEELEFETQDEDMASAIVDGRKTDFRLVLTPKMLHMMGRFLGKVGLEMLARDHADFARSARFDGMRRFTRFGEPTAFLWPIFYGSLPGRIALEPTAVTVFDTAGLIQGHDTYTLCDVTLGTESWIVCLNDPYPHPVIRESFPSIELRLLTY